MSKGFTLIQLIVSVAIVTVLAIAVFVTMNPAKRVGEARDTTRLNDILMIKQALTKYINDHQGTLPFSATITTNKKVLCSSATSLTCAGDTETCLTITDNTFFTDYLASLPVDPQKTAETDTGYYLTRDANDIIQVGSCTTYGSALTSATTFKDTGLFCGDEVCNNGEDCETCVADCGECPSGCEGHEANDLCWFVAANDTQSCNTVCINNGMTCSATNWNDDTSCTIMKIITPAACSVFCTSANSNQAPYYLSAMPSVCVYRITADQNCAAAGGGFPRVCACE